MAPNFNDRYEDVLWHLSPATRGKSRDSNAVRFEVFRHERELYERAERGDPTTGYEIGLHGIAPSPEQNQEQRARGTRLSSGEAQAAGQKLFYALPPQAQALLTKSSDRVRRIKISCATAALADLPWECLSDGNGPPFALRAATRIVRSVPVRFPPPTLAVAPPVRVLVVTTNPKDERLLDPRKEIAAIARRLNAEPYEFSVLEEPTEKALEQSLTGFAPHVLHYIGHSGVSRGDGNLILHGHDGNTEWLCPTELSRLLPVTVRLLCLGTCFTNKNYDIAGLARFAHAPATVSLPTAIVNRHPVAQDGSSVSRFWEVFYDTLAATAGDVTEAAYSARMAVSASSPDWPSFSLILRDGTGFGMRIGQEGTSAAELAAQIQAQFASRLANQAAEQMFVLGPQATKEARSQLENERMRMETIIKRFDVKKTDSYDA